MTRRFITRAGVAALALAAIVALASCSGAGNLPAGEAYLTISNPNSSPGTYTYSNLFVDSKPVASGQINAGGSYQMPVKIGQHDVRLDFAWQEPNQPAHPAQTVGPQTITVPTQGCTLIGPTPTSLSFSGC